MNRKKQLSQMSVEEIIAEAIDYESASQEFYRNVLNEVGPDVHSLIAHFLVQHSERIVQLERLQEEITQLRDLTIAIAG